MKFLSIIFMLFFLNINYLFTFAGFFYKNKFQSFSGILPDQVLTARGSGKEK